jgi:hypothetical protein
MTNIENTSSPSSTTVIIQPQTSNIDLKSNKLIFRLGWASFIFGTCAFIIHYISIDRLANFSPFNAGLISGFFLMIAGLASAIAGYQQTSYRCFIHAQIWSFIANILLAPGLIAVSIAALIIDHQDIQPICQSSVPSRAILFGNSFELYPSNIPCIEERKLFNLTQILNSIQLIIGFICFSVHIILLSIQRKVIKQMKMNDNDDYNNKVIVFTQPDIIDTGKSE